MALTWDEAVAQLDALEHDDDGEALHIKADKILLAHVRPEVANAYRRVQARADFWAFA